MTQANLNSVSASFNCDKDLIEACRSGDHQAQLQVYKLYYKSVYINCLRIVNDPVIAEDIMHESFLAAFENISSYCGQTCFYYWVNSFIKNNI